MNLTGHVARMWESRGVGKPEGSNHLEDPGVDGGGQYLMDLREVVCGAWTGSMWLSLGTVGGRL